MYSINDCLAILVTNGYIVTFSGQEKEMPTEKGPKKIIVYEASTYHRSVGTRYTSKNKGPEETFNQLVEFVKKNAPLDMTGYKEK